MSKKRDYTEAIERLFGAEDAEWRDDKYYTISPLREDKNAGGQFFISRSGGWHDSALSEDNSGHIKDLLIDCGMAETDKQALEMLFPGGQEKRTDYVYKKADGTTAFIVRRTDKPDGSKEIKQAHINQRGEIRLGMSGEYTKKGGGKLRPLYNLPEILQVEDNTIFVVVEGEKCADAFNQVCPEGYLATCWSQGAGNQSYTDFTPLQGSSVVLWPDNDGAGIDAMKDVSRRLAHQCRIVDTSDFEKKEDVADLIERGEDYTIHLKSAKAMYDGSDIYSIDMSPDEFIHLVGKQQTPASTLDNFRAILSHYGIVIRENLMTHKIETDFTKTPGLLGEDGSRENAALGNLESICILNRFPTGKLLSFITTVAHENAYHPARDAIDATTWDGINRMEAFYNLFTVDEDYPVALRNLLLKKWLVSAVAALYHPDFKARGVLTLQGPQGIGKTSILRSLFDDAWFEEGLALDPRSKDSVEMAISRWACELGELEGVFKRADIALLKSFITKGHDSIRFAYERRQETFRRRSVYCASVNESQFLTDHTGSSRFWVIPVMAIDYNHGLDVMQLWAEVKTIYRAGETWWLDGEQERELAEASSKHQEVDEMEELLAAHYQGGPKTGDLEDATHRMSATQILMLCGNSRPRKVDSNRMAQTLRRLGYRQASDKHRNYRWVLDPDKFVSAYSDFD